jgi:hypothetical protein
MAYTNIDDPSAHFQAFTYTGTGTNNSITLNGNSDLQPDLYWYKTRSNSNYHYLADSSRGTTNYIYPNDSLAEGTGYTGYVQSFDTNGVTVGAGDSGTNTNGTTFANWVWKANGGTTSSNTDGTITSTVQANQDAGFSIVTYTGTGVYNKTVGHGLGIAPAVVLLKNRTTGEASYDDWWVYHKDTSVPVNRGLRLNENVAEVSTTVLWSVVPSSTIFGVGGSVDAPRYTNGASQNYLAYCFAEKQGYSKFGKYIGNGNANGTFVYTGFKPAFLIMKRIDSTGAWHIFDNKRLGYNINNNVLQADSTAAELAGADYPFVDILSNGFKTRRPTYGPNVSGATYIYMAFAENPFVTSTGIPTTAR